MVFRGSNCAEWTKFEVVETLGSEMEKDEAALVVDVEEGEISNAASVEEGSKEDFIKHQTAAKVTLKESIQESRVWTMRDLYKTYPTICRGYASGLYNLAWAQAVQNKPLNDIFVLEVDPEKNAKRSSTSPSVKGNEDKRSVKEMDQVVTNDSDDEVDVKIVNAEKEEGELEEGEIDLDSEPVEIVQEVSRFAHDDNLNICKLENDSTQMELEKHLNLIQEALEKITVSDAEKSFEGVCSLLCRTFERLLELSSEDNLLRNEALIQPSFSAIKLVCSVFSSMSYRQKEENNHILLRLLSCMKKDKVSFLFPDQMKEIEALMLCGSIDYLPSFNKEVENQRIDATSMDIGITQPNKCQTLSGSGKMCSDNLVVGSAVHNNKNLASGLSGFKSRGALLPLLDLHKEHDADSLPSPTRERPKGFPVQKALVVEGGPGTVNFPTKGVLDQGDSRTRTYETDAIKAVSSYQQKFGRNSFLMNDRLPSPTPSEECDDGGNDVGEEVSSSTIGESFKILNSPIVNRPIGKSVASLTVASSPSIDQSAMQGMSKTKTAALVSCMPNSALKLPAKSRDPRLRYLMDVGSNLNKSSLPVMHSTSEVENGGFMCSKEQNIDDEPKVDVPAFKRQKCGESHSTVRNVKTNCGNGDWLEDTDSYRPELMKIQSIENSETEASGMFKAVNSSCSGNGNARGSVNEQVLITNTSSSASLPALLKDIKVNPAKLINLLKMGQQQQLATESQQRCNEPENGANTPTSHSILGAAPSVSASPSVSAPSLTWGILQIPVPGILPVDSQSTSMDELGKIRIKPRDPRRILHSNVLKNDGGSGNEQFKKNVPVTSSTQGSKDNLNGQNQEDQGDANAVLLPDIARQFTKSLINIADIISVSKTSSISHNLQTPTVSVKVDKEDMKADYADTGINSAPAVGETGTSHSQSTWEDVEHLFEGFDDHQKAAIQRERARRIGEQKKMFAKRKLSLVLDLDHTLLNSAKFMEVDPMHEEILRKKEELDREKPQRHLFRFPHMGMWTKLRPGIWNFLEKASKLFELHLYTMGNKLYATEMAKVLDPTKNLFSGRVISRGDDGELLDGDERVPKTKDLEGVLGMESSVVIIDDSVRVWPHNKLNLIVVERYTYFPCSRRQFGLLGPSLLEIDHDERPEDGTLASSLAVTERIHQNFFSHQLLDAADVRNILATEQQKILADCRILFSRVFPVGEANPHLHPLWKTAEQFGALCTNQIDEQVTHIVANSLGTNKVNWALSTGRFVVHPGWVEASALLYRRANEHDFTIKP